jgi:hypothetical protein
MKKNSGGRDEREQTPVHEHMGKRAINAARNTGMNDAVNEKAFTALT